MRRLLLAVLGAAGSLLMELPALAQLSSDTSTFSGAIAATCLFDGLEDSYSMIYYDSVNYLRSSAYFEISTNLPSIRVEVSQVTTNAESYALNNSTIYAAAMFYQRDSSGRSFQRAMGTKSGAGSTPLLDMTVGDRFRLDLMVYSNNRQNNLYQLGPGQYSYTTTISCLL